MIRRVSARARALPARLAQAFWLASASALLVASVCLVLAGLDRQFPPPLDALKTVSPVVVDREGRLLRAFTVADGRWRLPVSLDKVDPLFVDMLIAYEDKRFHRHNGLDPLAVLRAVGQFLSNGRIVSGASTLSMQLARLLEPRTSRSLSAKLFQVVRALQIERRLSKRGILQAYLTLAPYGGNLEGIRSAALAYFDKSPAKLAVHEAALLIALPQLPEARRPDRRPHAARAARDRVLKRMVEADILPVLDARLASSRPVPRRRMAIPASAAHLTERLRAENPDALVHKVTLDRTVQHALEALLARRIRSFGPKLSAAVMVAEAATGRIIARVGSADPLSQERQGAVDMTRAVRSPGSTLKPFIYALAFDAGLARPETLIDDSPHDFKGYAPTNFDQTYQGTIPVREALQKSLNVPAVALLDGVGPLRLMSLFKQAQIQSDLPQESAPSLAIALGGIGMRLEDLVQLYTAFPNLGASVSLTETTGPGTDYARLLSARSSWYINTILAGTKRPERARDAEIAFKTGTSYGYRDSWAVGFDGTHVVGVWVGRPDGASVPGLTGRSAAAPLLFEAFERLTGERKKLPGPPAGTLWQAQEELPVALRHFARTAFATPLRRRAPAPSISFPPDGARVELASRPGDGFYPVILKVTGGVSPFSWFADGAPIDIRNRHRNTPWTPQGPGFSTLTVIDARGRSDRVTVFLK